MGKSFQSILKLLIFAIASFSACISNTEIKLINQGTISNINVSNNQIEFRINISGKFRFAHLL